MTLNSIWSVMMMILIQSQYINITIIKIYMSTFENYYLYKYVYDIYLYVFFLVLLYFIRSNLMYFVYIYTV